MIGYVIPTWNGSRLGEMVSTLPAGSECTVIPTKDRKISLAQAWNEGIWKYLSKGYETVIVCNDDILLKPDTGTQLEYALHVRQYLDGIDPKVVLVTSYNIRDIPDVGCRWGDDPDYSCFAVGREYWDEIGPFDEGFKNAYFEDNDSRRRIEVAGLNAKSWCPVFHYGSSTIESDPVRKFEIQDAGAFEENRAYYIQKWGGDTGRERFITPFGEQVASGS